MTAAAGIGLSMPAGHAVGQDTPEPKRWKDQAEVAVVNTSGNSNVLTFSLKNSLQYHFSDKLAGTWNLAALAGRQDGETNAERFGTDLRLDHALSDHLYVYLLGGWRKDRFAGLDHRYHVGPGLGSKFLNGPIHFLSAEMGANWTREDYSEKETEDFLESRVFGQYSYKLSNNQKFVQSVEYLQDFNDLDNYKLLSTTSLTSAINTTLAIKLSYEVRFHNRPIPEDREKTDTLFSGSLVVSY